jgi:hypothetical protein
MPENKIDWTKIKLKKKTFEEAKAIVLKKYGNMFARLAKGIENGRK